WSAATSRRSSESFWRNCGKLRKACFAGGEAMTQTSSLLRQPLSVTLPSLEAGDHLDQKTFHERYEAMPEDFRAELIGGIVFVPSPLKRPHSRSHGLLIHWLFEYEDATPGVETHLD